MTELETESQGSVYRELWNVAWPVIVYSFLQWLVGAVDEWMVGRLGKEALSAVGMCRQILFFLMIVMLAVSTGTTTMTSQAHGAEDRPLVNSVLRQAIWMGVVISVVMGGIGFVLARSILLLMGASTELVGVGLPYLRVIFPGVGLMVMSFTITAAFRGVGDTKTPLYVSTVVNLIHVPANYILIFGAGKIPALGVRGAAWGTLLARSVGLVILLAILFRGRTRVGLALVGRKCLDLDVAGRILRVGLPSGGQGVARSGARMVLWRIVACSAFKVPALAAFVVAMRFRMMSIMLGLAFQTATAAIVGQRIGAGRHDEAERSAWAAVRMAAVPLMAMAIIASAVPAPIIAFFSRDPEVVRIGVTLVRILCASQFFTGLAITLGGALNGAGDTRPGLIITGIGQWFLMLPLSALLLFHFKMDPVGIWIGLAVADVTQCLLYVRRFRSGAWRRIQV